MNTQNSTFTFGITGGIGAGKSVVSDLLRHKGITILDADTIAKTLIADDADIRHELISHFGNDIYREDGSLNRGKLAEVIFCDRGAQTIVNTIVHPRVSSYIFDEINRMRPELVGVEAALLLEAQMDRKLDAVVVVEAPQEKRMRRLESRGVAPHESRRRMALQMPAEKMREKAAYLILNDGTLEDLASKVDELFQWLTKQKRLKGPNRRDSAEGTQV